MPRTPTYLAVAATPRAVLHGKEVSCKGHVRAAAIHPLMPLYTLTSDHHRLEPGSPLHTSRSSPYHPSPSYQARDPLLFGPNNQHIPKLVQCFVEVLGRGTQLVDEPLGRRMANLLHSMQPSLPGDLTGAAFNGLSDKHKAAFSAYMGGQPLPQ